MVYLKGFDSDLCYTIDDEYFGEEELIKGCKREHNILIVEDCQILEMQKFDFKKIFYSDYPKIGKIFDKSLIRKKLMYKLFIKKIDQEGGNIMKQISNLGGISGKKEQNLIGLDLVLDLANRIKANYINK